MATHKPYTLQEAVQPFYDGDSKEATARIIEFIYQHPGLFQYTDFNDDTVSEFVIYLLSVVPRILQSYSSDRCALTQYLVTVIRLYVKSWRRKMAKRLAENSTLVYCYKAENGFEDSVMTIDPEPESVLLPLDLSRFDGIPKRHYRQFILVLTLKSAYYLSDDHIRHIARAINYDETQLLALANCIRTKLAKKHERRRRIIESRNKSYFLKHKYALELSRVQPQSVQYEHIAKQLAFQTKSLLSKNRQLTEQYCMNATATEIARLLHKSTNTVRRLLGLLDKVN